MEDGSLRGKAQNGRLQNALEWPGGTAWRVDGSASFDELMYSATVSKRISDYGAGEHEEKSVAADACELMEDSRCRGAEEETLIDAQKPEWREEANGGCAGEKRFERPRDGRMKKQNGEQKHNRCALKQRRDASKDVLPENVEQDT